MLEVGLAEDVVGLTDAELLVVHVLKVGLAEDVVGLADEELLVVHVQVLEVGLAELDEDVGWTEELELV